MTYGERRGWALVMVVIGAIPFVLWVALWLSVLGRPSAEQQLALWMFTFIAAPLGGILMTIGFPLLVAASTDDPARRYVRTRAAAGSVLLFGALFHLGVAVLASDAGVLLLGLVLASIGLLLLLAAHQARSKVN